MSSITRSTTRFGALGRIRTCDTRFRRAVLYPLSYEGRKPSLQVTVTSSAGSV
jgi:hypothetical protein